MNFLKWLAQLPNDTRIVIILGIFAINCIVSFFIVLHIEKVYERTKSPEKAMNRMRLFNQYVQGGMIAISSFFIVFMSFPFFKSLGKIGKILSFSTFLLIIIVMLVAIQAIYYKPMKKIRDTTESATEQLKTTLRVLLVMFLPMTIILSAIIFLPDSIKEKANSSITGILLMMLFLAAINLIMPLFYKIMLKAVPMESSELREKLDLLSKRADLKKTSIYKWPTTKRKLANALVSGFIRKTIYISDYLIENASTDEIEAIVAHEIGHIKKYHLWIRMFLTIIPVPIFSAIGHGLDYYEQHYHTQIHELPVIIGSIVLYILYFRVIFLLFTRIQEQQADGYVLELGVNPHVYISALLKIAKLNHMVTKINKLDEKFQTHPSIAKRIFWIEKKSGISYQVNSESRESTL